MVALPVSPSAESIVQTIDARIRQGATATPGDYRLGATDKLRIKVFAWRPARDEVFEWTALNGEYSVGAAGTISLPLIGEVLAAELTTAELSHAITELLKKRIGLIEGPNTSVEVIQFRPFYILGHAERPGEYPFRPGLTVLQALGIAGGQWRQRADGDLRLEREIIVASGEVEVLASEQTVLSARKARLEAELWETDDIAFPARLTKGEHNPAAETAMAQERLIFEARREAQATQIAALEQLRTYLNAEVRSIEDQLETHNRQVALVREELTNIESLVAKKLSVEPRRLALQRNLAQVEGDRLRLESGLMRVKQEISKTDIALLDLRNKRSNDLTAELAVVQSKLDQIARRIDMNERLIYESEVLAPRILNSRSRARRAQPVFTIVRAVNGMTTEIAATESTLVAPGDTIKVEIPLEPRDPAVPSNPALSLGESEGRQGSAMARQLQRRFQAQ